MIVKPYGPSVIKVSKLAAERFAVPQQTAASASELETVSGEARIGLFYLASGFSQVYTKPFVLNTLTSAFGSHANFFKLLVSNEVLQGIDYETYPCGFTFYDAENELYALVAGTWITETMTAKICEDFNFNHVDSAYYAAQIPLYIYYNNGKSDLLPFVKEEE
jgi:hypothetical protein